MLPLSQGPSTVVQVETTPEPRYAQPMHLLLLALLPACDRHSADDSGAYAGEADTDTDTDTDSDTDTDTDADPITKEDRNAILQQANSDLSMGVATGAQIAVWYDGRVAYHWEIGTTDEAGSTPVASDTLFQIGSDTKKLTAVAFLQQEEAGLVSRDDTLASVLPDYEVAQDPGWSKAVTFHHLLSHQGDGFDYTPWDDAPDDAVLRDRAYESYAPNGWIYAPPGSFWNYGNPNYALTALAIEEVTGRPFADVLQEDVIDALGLEHTRVRLADVLEVGGAASGHGYVDWIEDPYDLWGSEKAKTGEAAPAELPDNAFTRPAGLVWSTAEDMAKLGGFFLEGDPAVLDAANRLAIMTPYARPFPAHDWYGYGYGTFWQRGFYLSDGYHDDVLVFHGGNTLTMTSLWWLLPDQGVAISILSNGWLDSFDVTAVRILEALDVVGPPDEKETVVSTTETDHALLVGTYVDPMMGEIDVSDTKGTLAMSIPAVDALGLDYDPTLYPSITDFYYWWVDGTWLEFNFVRDAKGDYRWIVTRILVGTKDAPLPSSPPPVDPSMRARMLRAYADGPVPRFPAR